MVTTEQVQQWLDDYRTAWETRDADAAAVLFTDDATYGEQPYEEPYRGREGVHAYWTRVTATQSDVSFRTGRVVTAGSNAAVEWWVTLRNDGAEATLAGEFFLEFNEGGLVRHLREYWHFAPGLIEPPAGWGQ
ncbi:nuclear transport factor 2 family protein [Microbacterium sp.]|uniref:nuclear transport factor 2 family protein n=1 Tax=Microbacterium sp. TaxID=51671 RepID=UPI00262120A5|nr:nuclear transport factor 2 family protein [Microbacterium sp.]